MQYSRPLANTANYLLPNRKRHPSQDPVSGYDANQNPNPRARKASVIPVLIQNASSRNLALRSKFGLVHTITARAARVRLVFELIYHHSLEDPSLRRQLAEILC